MTSPNSSAATSGAVGLIAVVAAGLIACAQGNKAYFLSTAAEDGGLEDAADASPASDAGTDVALGTDAAEGLDPALLLPPGVGSTCGTPGTQDTCAAGAICRIATPTGGRCETCGPCGNVGTSCTASSQCDLLMQCFKGRCAEVCPLGTSYCGAVADCVDVGHASHGVCKR